MIRKNLVPNPSFEVDLSGWNKTGSGTRTRSTTFARSGSASMKINGIGSASSEYQYTNNFAVTAGTTYTASAYFLKDTVVSGTQNARVGISYLDSGGNVLVYEYTDVEITSAATWQRVIKTLTAPTGTVNARVTVGMNLAANTVSYYVDSVMFEEGAAARTYFDGSFTNYAWQGTANNSTSYGLLDEPATDPVAPTADFGTTVSNLSVAFTNASIEDPNAPASWLWNFGDGTTSTAKNPTRAYDAAGTYTVSLTATNSVGSNTISKTVTVAAAPTPPATVNLIEQPTATGLTTVDYTNGGQSAKRAGLWYPKDARGGQVWSGANVTGSALSPTSAEFLYLGGQGPEGSTTQQDVNQQGVLYNTDLVVVPGKTYRVAIDTRRVSGAPFPKGTVQVTYDDGTTFTTALKNLIGLDTTRTRLQAYVVVPDTASTARIKFGFAASGSGTVFTNAVFEESVGPVLNITAGPDQTALITASNTITGASVGYSTIDDEPFTLQWTASGPGIVTFLDPTDTQTPLSFSKDGTYTLTLTATNGFTTISDSAVWTVLPAVVEDPDPTPTQAPVVNVGSDRTVQIPAPLYLAGAVTDTGGQKTYTWTASGPGTTTFSDSHAVNTTATFSTAGTYTITLTASDGTLSGSDSLVVTVLAATTTEPTNTPPTVNAGSDKSVTLPSTVSLTGTVSDDGIGVLSYQWTASGPGTVAFGNPTALTTNASFSTAGTYTLTLTASDGQYVVSDALTVTVAAQPAGPTDPDPTPIPDTSGSFVDGDTWFQRNSSGLILGHWEFSGGQWVKKGLSGTIIDTLDAGKLTAGSAFTNDLFVKAGLTLGDATTNGVIKSYNYESSTSGIRIDKNGLTAKGGSLTGVLVQSDPAANKGIKFNSSALIAYNASGQATFSVNAATGDVAMTGELRSGSVISGATLAGPLQTTTVANRGVKVTNTGIYAYDSVTGSPTLGQVTFSVNANTGAVIMKGALTTNSTVDGAIITGGTIQTDAAENRGIKMSNTGFVVYDSKAGSPTLGQPMLTITPSTGSVAMYGGLISGGNIQGAVITGSNVRTNKDGSGVELADGRIYIGFSDTPDSKRGIISPATSNGKRGTLIRAENGVWGLFVHPTGINADSVTTDWLKTGYIEARNEPLVIEVPNGKLQMTGGSNINGRLESYFGNAAIAFTGGKVVAGIGGYNASNPNVNNTQSFYARDINAFAGLFDQSYNNGGSTGANINANGRVVRASSSLRYKNSVKTLDLNTAKGALNLEAVTFKWNEDMAMGSRRHPGFIAEQAHEAGMDMWVTYEKDDESKKPDGFRYSELTAAHNVLIKDLYAKIEELEQRLDAA